MGAPLINQRYDLKHNKLNLRELVEILPTGGPLVCHPCLWADAISGLRRLLVSKVGAEAAPMFISQTENGYDFVFGCNERIKLSFDGTLPPTEMRFGDGNVIVNASGIDSESPYSVEWHGQTYGSDQY